MKSSSTNTSSSVSSSKRHSTTTSTSSEKANLKEAYEAKCLEIERLKDKIQTLAQSFIENKDVTKEASDWKRKFEEERAKTKRCKQLIDKQQDKITALVAQNDKLKKVLRAKMYASPSPEAHRQLSHVLHDSASCDVVGSQVEELHTNHTAERGTPKDVIHDASPGGTDSSRRSNSSPPSVNRTRSLGGAEGGAASQAKAPSCASAFASLNAKGGRSAATVKSSKPGANKKQTGVLRQQIELLKASRRKPPPFPKGAPKHTGRRHLGSSASTASQPVSASNKPGRTGRSQAHRQFMARRAVKRPQTVSTFLSEPASENMSDDLEVLGTLLHQLDSETKAEGNRISTSKNAFTRDSSFSDSSKSDEPANINDFVDQEMEDLLADLDNMMDSSQNSGGVRNNPFVAYDRPVSQNMVKELDIAAQMLLQDDDDQDLDEISMLLKEL